MVFIKSNNEGSDKGYFLEVDVQHSEKLHNLHNDFPCLPGKIRIRKAEKGVANLHDRKKYAIYIRKLKQALNHG